MTARELLVDRLINVGYAPGHAQGMYNLYYRNDDLDNLEKYIASKEAIARDDEATCGGQNYDRL